jgi:ribosomal protein S27E
MSPSGGEPKPVCQTESTEAPAGSAIGDRPSATGQKQSAVAVGSSNQLPLPTATGNCGIVTVRCPHCHNPLHLSERNSADEVLCPACGSSFRIEDSRPTDTTSLMRQSLG